MAKWSEVMAEGGSAAAQPMGLSVGVNQWAGHMGCDYCTAKDGEPHQPSCVVVLGQYLGGKAIDTWDTCPHCNCKDGHYSFCATQLRLREDNPADEPSCPTCKDGVCQCGPDEDECPDCGDRICDCWLEDVDEGTEEWVKVTVQPAYYDLFIVLQKALYQAQDGKGAERHGNGLSFTEQPALTITRAVGLGFPLGQAMKKIQESQRMDTDAAKRELLGAINYLAAAVLFLNE